MSMGKRRRQDGDEQDAASRFARRYFTSLQRPGVRAWANRKARRRERHEAKLKTRRGEEE